jgi:hypothetical protein
LLRLSEAAARPALQLPRNLEEHLSLVIGNANRPHACIQGRGEQHGGGNVEGSEPNRTWIVDRLQLVTEHYSLPRLQQHNPSPELQSEQDLTRSVNKSIISTNDLVALAASPATGFPVRCDR